ncbi:unnamed protein product [Rotaria sordida]|uniref:Chloride channel CLIC-like protein 1 n=1 Tax=Rotaria sordida TaxID=392033 RepID=A0A815RZN4_9BILA|nr:unnamed protein product [Rotaria sordida]
MFSTSIIRRLIFYFLKVGESCPATFQTHYKTILASYHDLVKSWVEKFPSKNAKEYRLALKFFSNHLDRLKEFASASCFEEKDVLPEIHSISDILKHAAYKPELKAELLNSLTWSAWFRSLDINVVVQEAHAKIDHILLKKLPKHCLTDSQGFLRGIKSHITSWFSSQTDECLEYRKASRAVPHAQATVVQAMSMTIAQLFITPLGLVGEKFSEFFAGTMHHVPRIAWPIVVTVTIFILVFVTLVVSRYEIHAPMMLFSIRPSFQAAMMELKNKSNQSENTIEQLKNKIKELTLKQKPAIEDKAKPTQHVSGSSSNERIPLHSPHSRSNQPQNSKIEDDNDSRPQSASPEHFSEPSNIENTNDIGERSLSNQPNSSSERCLRLTGDHNDPMPD